MEWQKFFTDVSWIVTGTCHQYHTNFFEHTKVSLVIIFDASGPWNAMSLNLFSVTRIYHLKSGNMYLDTLDI